VSETLSDRLKIADVVILARLADPVAATASRQDANPRYTIEKVFKGQSFLSGRREVAAPPPTEGAASSAASTAPAAKPAVRYLILGAEPPDIFWLVPMEVSSDAVAYVERLSQAPEAGPQRLAWFYGYLNHKDPFVADDAYGEFAKADFPIVKAAKDRFDAQELLAWSQDASLPVHRRRLFLTLLGVCGATDDAPRVQQIIESDLQTEAAPGRVLDAAIACYLSLRGADGLPYIDRRILKDPSARFSDIVAAILALRFHGEQEQMIPRDRLLGSMRLILDRPKWADQVIPDLARWEDWSVRDKLIELFRTAEQVSDMPRALRVPIARYFKACPLPEASSQLEQLVQIDAESVRRADDLPLIFGEPPRGPQSRAVAAGPEPQAQGQPTPSARQGPAPPAAASLPIEAPPPEADSPAGIGGAEDSAAGQPPPESETPAIRRPDKKPRQVSSGLVAGLVIAAGLLELGLLFLIFRGFRPRLT
jgi:hypothetical protein